MIQRSPYGRAHRLTAVAEAGPYLGIAATPAPPVVREQLKLPPGVGLVVEFVQPDSPAAEAGIKLLDVLHMFNDQILVNPEQLEVLIRNTAAGEEVTLTLVRQGEQQETRVTLDERQSTSRDGTVDVARPTSAPPGPPQTVMHDLEKLKWELDMHDREHHLRLGYWQDQPYLIARDPKGELLFEGPVATPEQRRAVPADIAEKLEPYFGTSGPATQPAPAAAPSARDR